MLPNLFFSLLLFCHYQIMVNLWEPLNITSNLTFIMGQSREFPGLEVLIEALREDIGLLDMAITGIPESQHEILYTTLLGMTPDERHRLLKICITHGPEDRSFLLQTIGNGLIDKLTAVYNRTKFNTDLSAAIEVVDRAYHQQELPALLQKERRLEAVLGLPPRASASQGDVTLLLLDIDKFKRVNDVYGHPTGDRALQLVATIAVQSLRLDDHQRFYRYGGEEFAVILPYTSVEQGSIIAERIRQNIEERLAISIPKKGRSPVRGITVSVGLANYRATTAMASELINQADFALYAAKYAGRNCVRVYDQSLLGTKVQSAYLKKLQKEEQ